MRKVLVIIGILLCMFQQVAYAASGEWKQTNGRWWYQYSDGSYPKNEWVQINGEWYHFDSAGWMEQGWITVGGKSYHLNDQGQMETGWISYLNKWYYLERDGSMRTRFLNDGTANYMFNSGGDMYYTKLTVPLRIQEQTNWCWAASSKMTGDYKGGNHSQRDIVNTVLHTTDAPNKGGSAWDISSAMTYASNGYKAFWRASMNTNELIRLIDEKKPFVVGVLWSPPEGTIIFWRNGAHAICGVGYNLNKSLIYFQDPARDVRHEYHVNFDELDGGYFTQVKFGDSGTGHYITTNYFE